MIEKSFSSAEISGGAEFPEGFDVNSPILVYGPRKGGTTLLQALVDGAAGVLMFPGELKLKQLARRQQLGGEALRRFFRSNGHTFFNGYPAGRIPENFAFEGMSAGETARVFNAGKYFGWWENTLINGPDNLPDLLQADAKAFRDAVIDFNVFHVMAAKEVGGPTGEIFDLFLRCYPKGKILGLVRQPEFVVRSIIMDRRRAGRQMGLRHVWRECRVVTRVLGEIFRNQHRLTTVVYEQITATPEATLKSACRNLGIPFVPTLLFPSVLGIPVVVKTSSRPEKTIFRSPGPWTQDLKKGEVASIRIYRFLTSLLPGRWRWSSYGEAISRANGAGHQTVTESAEKISSSNPQ